MATATTMDSARADPHHLDRAVEHPGPAPKHIVTAYGFWIFLLSDIVMFSCFFATYAVLVHQTAGGPKGSEIFDQKNLAIETICLLFSSFSCGDGQHRRRSSEQGLVLSVDGGDLRAGAGIPRD